jgi:hypothetical protein
MVASIGRLRTTRAVFCVDEKTAGLGPDLTNAARKS